MNTALTIAGSDPSGGAGIQADLKTMLANGVYGMSAVTALTAQNTTGVFGIFDVTPEFLALSLDAIFTDIFPEAVKIGMVSSAALTEVIAEKLVQYSAKNIVVDPVMVATSGSALIRTDASDALERLLFPIASLITPNIPECEILTGISIKCKYDMHAAAKALGDKFGVNVLLKGGHNTEDANDLLYSSGDFRWFYGKRINTQNTHGTGCTLSSAIASNLANGLTLSESIECAKEYISSALSSGLNLGKGSGPLNHGFAFSKM